MIRFVYINVERFSAIFFRNNFDQSAMYISLQSSLCYWRRIISNIYLCNITFQHFSFLNHLTYQIDVSFADR